MTRSRLPGFRAIAAATPARCHRSSLRPEDAVDGAQVIAVDGVPAREINIVKLIGGTDVVGSRCKLTVRRGLQTFDALVGRTSETRLQEVSKQHQLLAALVEATRGTQTEQKARELMHHAEQLEGERLEHEAKLAAKLWYSLAPPLASLLCPPVRPPNPLVVRAGC